MRVVGSQLKSLTLHQLDGLAVLAHPGFKAGFARAGHGVEAPDFLAGIRIVGRQEAAYAVFAAGDFVVGMGGWQLYALSDGTGLRKLPADDSIPIEAYIGPAGMPGITAWVGTTQIIKPKAGETYVVSAATGAVGTVAGQLVIRIAQRHAALPASVGGSSHR